ncbi:O-antigen ligase family protein [Candidatus Parcubacteria bacterium]|nr:O-antigen ligase family protein [Candidatus Parcubacteria bacterium]
MTKKEIVENLFKFARFLVFAVLFVPLILASNTYFPFISPKTFYFFFISELLFFIWLILAFLDKRYRPKPNLVLFALVVFLVSFILSTIFGIDPEYSFWSKFERATGLLFHLHLFGFFLALSSLFSFEDFKKFFLVSIAISAFVGILGILFVTLEATRRGSTIGNESFLGTYLLINLFFALYLSFDKDSFVKNFAKLNFIFIFISLVFGGVIISKKTFPQLILALFFTEGMRAAKISTYGGLIFFFFLFLFFKSQNKFFRVLLSLIIFLSLFAGAYFAISFTFGIENPLYQLLKQKTNSLGGRMFAWKVSKEAFKEKPILGWGPENFEFAFLKHYHPCFGTKECGSDVWYDRAHNIIWDTLVAQGILGLACYFFVLFCLIFVLWGNYFKEKKDFILPAVFTSLFGTHFLQNLTVFDMICSFVLLFLTFAFIANLGKEKKEPSFYSKNSSLSFGENLVIFLCVFGFLLCAFYFIFLPYKTNIFTLKAYPKDIEFSPKPQISQKLEPKREDPFIFTIEELPKYNALVKRRYYTPPERIKIFKKALESSPWGFYHNLNFCTSITLNFWKSPAKEKATKEELKEEMEFLVQKYQEAFAKNPLNYFGKLQLYQLLLIWSQYYPEKLNEAEKIAHELIELSPRNQRGYWALAEVLAIKKDKSAIALLEKALQLEPRLKESHLRLIKVLYYFGETNLAKEKIREALEIDPSFEEELKQIKSEMGY